MVAATIIRPVKLLAIDTSSSATVLGLQVGDEILDHTSRAVRTHSREILPSIERLLGDAGVTPAELDAIIFGQGPGSFTGLRIAAGVVQGLCYGLDIPAVPVSSMACLAQPMRDRGDDVCVFVALTARLEEIYFGSYRFDNGFAVELAPEGVLDVNQLPAALNPSAAWFGAGNAWQLVDRIEASLNISFKDLSDCDVPDASDLLAIGRHRFDTGHQVDAMHAIPVYLREEVASRPGAG